LLNLGVDADALFCFEIPLLNNIDNPLKSRIITPDLTFVEKKGK